MKTNIKSKQSFLNKFFLTDPIDLEKEKLKTSHIPTFQRHQEVFEEVLTGDG